MSARFWIALYISILGARGGGVVLAFNPRAIPPAVEGIPYIAKVLCHKGAEKEPITSGMIFRDSKGRLRVDYFDAAGQELIRVIDDVPEKKLFVIVPSTGDVDVESYGSRLKGWSYRSVEPVETSGNDTIRGVKCSRVRLRTLGSPGGADAGETWIANQLGIVMKDVNVKDGWVWEVTEIDFREPPADVFHVEEKGIKP